MLTKQVMHGDREAIRNITKRIQTEETWKICWKQMEKDRHADTRVNLEQRMAYNDLLMELAGQPGRHRDPNHSVPVQMTDRLEEISKPAEIARSTDFTKQSDYAGLLHVDHRHALEARYPGAGHELSVLFAEKVSESARPGWPPPAPAETPPQSARKRGVAAAATPRGTVRTASVPVAKARLDKVAIRHDTDLLSQTSVDQFQGTEAPPAPDQRNMLLQESLVNDPAHMTVPFSPRTEHTTRLLPAQAAQVDIAPPHRPMVTPWRCPPWRRPWSGLAGGRSGS